MDKYKCEITISKKWWSNIWYGKFLEKLSKHNIDYTKESNTSDDEKKDKESNKNHLTTITFIFIEKEDYSKFVKVWNKFKWWHISWSLK